MSDQTDDFDLAMQALAKALADAYSAPELSAAEWSQLFSLLVGIVSLMVGYVHGQLYVNIGLGFLMLFAIITAIRMTIWIVLKIYHLCRRRQS